MPIFRKHCTGYAANSGCTLSRKYNTLGNQFITDPGHTEICISNIKTAIKHLCCTYEIVLKLTYQVKGSLTIVITNNVD